MEVVRTYIKQIKKYAQLQRVGRKKLLTLFFVAAARQLCRLAPGSFSRSAPRRRSAALPPCAWRLSPLSRRRSAALPPCAWLVRCRRSAALPPCVRPRLLRSGASLVLGGYRRPLLILAAARPVGAASSLMPLLAVVGAPIVPPQFPPDTPLLTPFVTPCQG